MEIKTLKHAFFIPGTSVGEWLHVVIHTDETIRTEPTDTARMLSCKNTPIFSSMLEAKNYDYKSKPQTRG